MLTATGLLLTLGAAADGGEAAAAQARSQPLIVSPAADARHGARPLLVRVRAGSDAALRARLNGSPIGGHFAAPRRGVRGLRVAPDHGLRYGANRLVVRVRARGGRWRAQTVDFHVRRDRPLAAAGRDLDVIVGRRVRVGAARSLSHLTTGARTPAGHLRHRWRVVAGPDGRRAGRLTGASSPRPLFQPTAPGDHVLELTVTAPDGRSGSDRVVLDADLAPVAPYIDAVAGVLRDRNPGTEGKVWWISTGNALPADWLLQTPDCWGAPTCGPGPLPPSAAAITSRMTAIVAQAQQSVELTGLWPPPDGAFRDAIVAGLRQAVQGGRTPTLRVVLGTPPFQFDGGQFTRWVDAIAADVGGKLPIQAAAASTYRQVIPPAATSWNHAKILAVDGRSAVVGGMNYWTGDYLQVTDPVDDVSITVDGPAAADAARFTDVLWGWLCANERSMLYVSMEKRNVGGCISTAPRATPSAVGQVPILTLGRLGNGIPVPGAPNGQSPPIPKAPVQGSACNIVQRQVSDTNTDRGYEYRNPGENGLRALIASAKRSIFISQQDLLSCIYQTEAYFDERVLAALGRQIVAGVPITIVLSAEGAKAGAGDDYSNGRKLTEVANVLQREVAALKPGANARALVCKGVGLAGVRTLDARTWPNGNPFANHAKLVWVDGAAFYVGSENLYPARLQELGMLVEDAAAAATLKASYLDPLWTRSRAGALIDPERGVCGSF